MGCCNRAILNTIKNSLDGITRRNTLLTQPCITMALMALVFTDLTEAANEVASDLRDEISGGGGRRRSG